MTEKSMKIFVVAPGRMSLEGAEGVVVEGVVMTEKSMKILIVTQVNWHSGNSGNVFIGCGGSGCGMSS